MMKRNRMSIVTTQQAELGQAFVANAERALQEKTQAVFQNAVNDVIRKIDDCERTIKLAQAGLAHFTRQKEALESGQFDFHPWEKRLIYREPALNKLYMDADYPHLKV